MRRRRVYKVILFDFDGVLIDSAEDIKIAVNTTFLQFGYKALDTPTVIKYVGNGSRRLLVDSLAHQGIINLEPALFEELYVWYRKWYEDNPVVETVLYDGVLDLLITLQKQGIFLAIVSNKPLGITHCVLEHLGIDSFFSAVVCPELVTNIKPDPEGLDYAVKNIEKKHGVTITPADVLMVGDSATDIQAGKRYGCDTCAVKAGIGHQEDLLKENATFVVEYAAELKNILESK